MAASVESRNIDVVALNVEYHNGNIYVAVKNSEWIIDLGAVNHMTFNSINTSSLVHTTQKSISTSNGDLTPVIGKGTLNLTVTMNLDSVLVAPSLNYNLLSVSQLTIALHCVVTFWPDHCVFKDILTRKTIGYCVRRGKLYCLELKLKNSDQEDETMFAK